MTARDDWNRLVERQRAGETEPCGECGRPMLVGGEGICYQCSCELHAIGAIDMDNDPWRGPVEPVRYEGEGDYEDEARPYAMVVLPPGVQELLDAADANEIPF